MFQVLIPLKYMLKNLNILITIFILSYIVKLIKKNYSFNSYTFFKLFRLLICRK